MRVPLCLLLPCLALPAQWAPPFEVGGLGQQQPFDTWASQLCPTATCDRLTMWGCTLNWYSIGVPSQFDPANYGTLRLGGTIEFRSYYQDPTWGVGSYRPLFVMNWRASTVPGVGPGMPLPIGMPLRNMLFIEPIGAHIAFADSSSALSISGAPVDLWTTFLTLPLSTYSLVGLTFSAQHVHLGAGVLSNEWLVTITF